MEHEPTATPPRRGAVSRWVLRIAASANLVAGFAQPVFAGVYLSGDFDGLLWHSRGADLVSYTGLLAIVPAVALWIRGGPAWPFAAYLALGAAEWIQYKAGLSGSLWLHIPLGVTVVLAVTALCAAIWLLPLPARTGAEKAERKANRKSRPATGAEAVTADA